jgi:hypothetical protein
MLPPLTFTIRDSHYRARLDATRTKVLCQHPNCGEIAYIKVAGLRELCFPAGWHVREDGVIIPSKQLLSRLRLGHKPGWRQPMTLLSNPGEDKKKRVRTHAGWFVHQFPRVVICPRCFQYNVLDPKRLDVMTEEEQVRGMVVSMMARGDHKVLASFLKNYPEEWLQRWQAEGLIPSFDSANAM